MTGGTVVVLGPTGRNIAAGMSGGTAYVLDVDPGRVNREMVDVEVPSRRDLDFLHEVVSKHRELTGSTVAASLLGDWPRRSRAFAKIMPRDYRRVLEAVRLATVEGRDPDEAIMEAAHG
jgi:glutamate synthase (NADPH/NADH) large chain